MSGCPSTGRNLGNALSARKSTRSPSLDNYRASREAVERSGAHGVELRAVAPEGEQDAGDLASEGDDGDELAAAFLDLERPGDHGGNDAAAASAPGGLNEASAQRARAGLGDAEAGDALGGGALAGDEPERGLDLMGGAKGRHVVEDSAEAKRSDGADAGDGHETDADGVVGRELFDGVSEALELGMDRVEH